MKKKYLYLLLRVLVYLLVLGAILYGLYESPYNPHPHSAEDIRRWVVGFGVWAPLIYVAVYTIRPLLLFPTLLLNLSAGVLFGPWWGILFLLLGGFGCASFCYLLGRFGGGSWLLRNFGGSWGERLTHYLVGSGSFKKMIILRTVPIFPYDPVSIIAGSVRLPFKIYAAATVLGMLPGAIAYNFLADAFGTPRFYAALAVTLLAFGIPLVWWQKNSAAQALGSLKNFGKGSDDNGKEYRDCIKAFAKQRRLGENAAAGFYAAGHASKKKKKAPSGEHLLRYCGYDADAAWYCLPCTRQRRWQL